MQNQNPPAKSNVNITQSLIPDVGKHSTPAITLAFNKGGVGKTTSTIHLAHTFAHEGLTVIICDTDPQGNSSKTELGKDYPDLMIEIFQGNSPDPLPTSNPRIFILPATRKLTTITDTLASDFTKLFRLKEYLAKTNFDIALIDTPPTLTGISIAAQIAATHTIMPISPHFYSLQGANDLMNNYRQLKEHLNTNLEFLGVLITDFDKRTALGNEICTEIKTVFKEKVFDTIIPHSVAIEEALTKGKSIIDTAPGSKISKLYFKLAEEILQRVNR